MWIFPTRVPAKAGSSATQLSRPSYKNELPWTKPLEKHKPNLLPYCALSCSASSWCVTSESFVHGLPYGLSTALGAYGPAWTVMSCTIYILEPGQSERNAKI
ncbi:hypothetical protein ACN38_g3042 [Penicillium nordicum]|uniref:Uncharacterized protein n=1 Tax=Penicillium nordicum TaxID=229535 RepID=A0A0M8PDK4_9EURO|nr:hypothetical protein ACN38_g3042 [Penicillium nordicum]